MIRLFGKYRERADRRDQAKTFQHPEGVGPDLDAGADFLELGRLLDELRGDTLPLQRQGRGQAADAAADDQNLLVLPILTHCALSQHFLGPL